MLAELSTLEIVPQSLVVTSGAEFALVRADGRPSVRLAVLAEPANLADLEGDCSEVAGRTLLIGRPIPAMRRRCGTACPGSTHACWACKLRQAWVIGWDWQLQVTFGHARCAGSDCPDFCAAVHSRDESDRSQPTASDGRCDVGGLSGRLA